MPLHECPESLVVACCDRTRNCQVRRFCDRSGHGVGLREHERLSWSHSVSELFRNASVAGPSNPDKALLTNNIVSRRVLIRIPTQQRLEVQARGRPAPAIPSVSTATPCT